MNRKVEWLLHVVIIAFVIVALSWKWIYYRVYPFARITGTYSISLNGKDIGSIDEYYEYENEGKIRLENDTETFNIKGGKYGVYKIGFMLSDDELYRLTKDSRFINYGDVDLCIFYFETNWWNITNLNINIDLVEEHNEWYICYDVECVDALEDDDEIAEKVSKKVKLTEVSNSDIIVGI